MKLVIAGGTGSLGRRVAEVIHGAGHDVVILSRRPRADIDHRQFVWDGRTVGGWVTELEGAVLLNLAGALVDRPPPRGMSRCSRDRGSSRPERSWRRPRR